MRIRSNAGQSQIYTLKLKNQSNVKPLMQTPIHRKRQIRAQNKNEFPGRKKKSTRRMRAELTITMERE